MISDRSGQTGAGRDGGDRTARERAWDRVEHLPAGYFFIGLDGRYQDVNAAWLRMHGFSEKAEALGVNVLDLVPPADRAQAERLLAHWLAGGDSSSEVLSRLHRDGSIRSGNYSAGPVFDQGRVTGVEGFLFDITEQKREQQQRLAIEQRYAAILAALNDGVVFQDADGKLEFWNARAEEILGLPGDQLTGRTSMDPRWGAIHADGSPFPGEEHPAMHTLRTGQPVSDVEMGVRRPDGSLCWITINSMPLGGGAGGPRGVVTTFHDCTVQRAEARALAEAEQRYRDLFENAVEGICRADPETGRVLSANAAEARIFGYDSAEELMEATAATPGILWMDAAERSKYVRTIEQLGEVHDYEVRGRRKDGSAVWISFYARRVSTPDDPARAAYLDGFVIDVTERKLAQARFETAEQMMNVAQAAARFGVFRWSVASGETHWSPGKYALFGLDPGSTQPSLESWLEHGVCLEGRGRARREFARVLEDPTGRVSLEYRTPDGRWMAALGQLYRDQRGQPETVVGISIDITERKHLEQELRLGNEILAHITEGTLLIRLQDLTILYTNPQLEKIFGYGPGEMVGLPVAALNAPTGPGPEAVARSIVEELDNSGLWQGEIENVRKDGTPFWCDALASVFHHEHHGRVCVSMLRDLTATKLAQAEKARLESELRDAQRLESVGRLAGGVAHDFNNLLTVINGYAALLAERLDEDKTGRGYAVEIGKAGETAANLASQLLAFSQRQYSEPREIELNAIIRDAERHFRRALPPGVTIRLELDPRLGHMHADPRQVNQVLMNLVTNARDAMPEGGVLRICTSNIDLDNSQAATHEERKPGSFVLIEVGDTGCGMDAETRRQIFEPFFTTKELGQGTGLGLATVHGIVKQNGGWIEVESELNCGTRFLLYLPRITPGQASPSVAEEEAPPKILTVLVVEDDQGVRKLTRAVLESIGYSVLEAREGYTAYELAKRHKGEINLLLTDVILPGMNGREVSEHLMRLRPDLKVLFMSGFPADVLGPGGVLGEDSAFLQKPFTADGLLRRVREVLGEE